MDISDERRKKLEAGKEKLAAFRKKKAKVKKGTNDGSEGLNVRDDAVPHTGDITATCGPFQDEKVLEPPPSNEARLPASEMEKSGENVDTAEAVLTQEYQPTKRIPVSVEENAMSPETESSDLEQALIQRDRLIQDLAASLKANADQQTEKEDLASQVLSLAQHVSQLQTQLKEADQTLQDQLQFHGISSSALESAKTQMLQLQSIVHAKDEELLLASQQLEKNMESLQQSKEENAKLSQSLKAQEEQLENLQLSIDSSVLSHEEKQEKEDLEKCQHIPELQNQWREKEEEMSKCIEKQAMEIEEWKRCESQWKERESQLRNDFDGLVHRLQQEDGKGERLQALEAELDLLRRQHETSQEEILALRKENQEEKDNHKSCLSELEKLSDDHKTLSVVHSSMASDFEALKEANADLEESLRQTKIESERVRSDLQELSSKLMEEQQKLETVNVYQAEVETKHSLDCDKLNNKINELQSSLSQTQESLFVAERALSEERDSVKALQQDNLAKESSLSMLSQELSDLTNINADVHTQLLAKEKAIKELHSLLSEKSSEEERFKNKEVDLNEDKLQLEESVAKLTKELNELRNQCDKYAAQLVQQEDNISANHVHSVETSEKEYSDLKIADAVSNFTDENLNLEKEKCGILEAELQIVEDKRKELNENIKSLNDEICALKGDLENEKAKSDILRDEMLIMDDKLVDAQSCIEKNIVERRKSDSKHSRVVDEYKSDISRLEKRVNEYEHDSEQLNLKLTSSDQELDEVKENLVEAKESLEMKSSEVETLKTDMESMKERERQSVENQEELQGQLECTINQWQKLQVIVQEKEIELQNLQEDLDEQKRICCTLRKNHEEELEALTSNVSSLKDVKKHSNAHIKELERKLEDLQRSLEAKEAQFSDTVSKLHSSDSSYQTLTNDLMDKNAQLHAISYEKEKVSAELLDSLKDIESLKEDLDKAKHEMTGLNDELKTKNDELNCLQNIVNAKEKEQEYAIGELEKKNEELSVKEQDLTSQIEELKSKNVGLKDSLETRDNEFNYLENTSSAEKKEKESVIRELEKINEELFGKEQDFTLQIDDLKSKNDSLNEMLETRHNSLTSLENFLSAEKKDKESVLGELEQKKEELTSMEHHLTSQIEDLKTKVEEAELIYNQLSTENKEFKVAVSNLESLSLDQDKNLSEEQGSKQRLESLLDKECKKSNNLEATVSALLQDVQGKEELLILTGTLIEDRTAELAERDAKLVGCLDDIKILQDDLCNARDEAKAAQQSLKESKEENESLLTKLKRKESEFREIEVNQDDLKKNAETVKQEATKVEDDLIRKNSEIENLHTKVSHLESLCDEKDKLLSTEQNRTEQLVAQLDREQQQCNRLEGLLSSLSADSEDKGKSLLELSSALEEKASHLSQLEEDLREKKDFLLESNSDRLKLEAKVGDLTLKESSLQSEVTELKCLVEKHEQDLSGISQMNKELHEKLNLVEQEIKKRDGEILDLKQDNDIIAKDCIDLKAELQEKETKNFSLTTELEGMNSALQTSSEEKEMLKNNFDACLEEMQQKLSDQEAELCRYKGQMTEELRNQLQSQDEMKEIYSQQLSQMEDKLMVIEREKTMKEKEVDEGCAKLEAVRDEYEQQVSELELNVQNAQSESMKLNDTILKINTDHDNELRDLKNLHEIQTAELMDNCLSLEKSMAELQKTMNEQANSMKQERNEMEQSFENLMSEMDERKRRSDSDVSRLKMQQDEMKKDHENEMKALEKKYERQLFDLEDRCSVLTSEMERKRKSLAGVEGDFAEERQGLEDKIEGLESVRRDLEIKCSILEDDLSILKEQSSTREGEMKSILKTAADKESENKSEILELKEKLASLKRSSKSSEESMKRELESKLEDLSGENKHLKSKVTALEQNAELYSETKAKDVETNKNEDTETKVKELQKQVANLTEENLLLKRRLLSQKSLEKKVRLQSGVEDICPPLGAKQEDAIHPTHVPPVTSTPSKKDSRLEEPLTPTGEEVSLIEGFISESSQKPSAAVRREKMMASKSGDEEPDFVFEERDRFQPEEVIEQAVQDFDRHNLKPDIHPIGEDEVVEGFQPEISDQFFVEISENNGCGWPINLSVGMSPTSKKSQQFVFDKKEEESQPVCEESFECQASSQTFAEKHPERVDTNEPNVESDEMKKRLKQMREDLEEEYFLKLRKQEQNIVLEYEAKQETNQQEMEFHFAQKEKSIRNDWEKKFARALQRMKKDFEKKLRKQEGLLSRGSKSRQKMRDEAAAGNEFKVKDNQEDDGMPDIEEGREELGEVVEQLSKDNQELAEVRDLLLKQIEISQAKGLHHRVQHELQSMLSERDKDTVLSSDNIPCTPTNEAIISERCLTSQVVELCAAKPGLADVDEDGNPAENSETSSVAAERFLEELEDMSQPSCQDLPLEWELTSSLAEDTSVPGNGNGHQSIWEVFDSRCVRQDCLEVRHRYRKLCKCVVKSFGLGEDLVLEESGLFQGAVGGTVIGENQVAPSGSSTVLNKGETNIDNLDEEEVDELFADNVALESQLLSLAENMVVYKKAFVKEKQDLERENEFLRLELETNSLSRLELEKQLTEEREEMMKRSEKEISIDRGVMTDLSSEALEEEMQRSLVEKQEIIDSLQQDIECLKSGFEEMFCQYKVNTERRLSALEDEVEDLKTENKYLYLTHEGKEETIAKSLTEIDELKSNLGDYENNLSSVEFKVNSLEDQVRNLEDTNKNLSLDSKKKSEQISELIEGKEKLEERLSLKVKEIETCQRNNADLTDQTVHLLSTLDEKEKVLKNLSSELYQSQLNCTDLEQRLFTKNLEVDGLETKISDLEEQVAHLQTGLAEKTEQIDSLSGETNKLMSERKDEKKNSSDKDLRLEAVEKELADVRNRNKDMQQEISSKEDEVTNLKASLAQVKSKEEEIVSRSTDQDVKIQDLETSISSLERDKKALLVSLGEKEEMIASLEPERAEFKSQLKDLKEELLEKETQVDVLENNVVAGEDKYWSLHATSQKSISAACSLEHSLSNMESRVEDLTFEKDKVLHQCEEKDEVISTIQDKLQDALIQLRNLQTEKEGLVMIGEERENSISNLKAEVGHLETQLQELLQNSADKSILDEFNIQVSELKAEKDVLQAAVEVKDGTVKEKEQEIDNLKSQLNDVSNKCESMQKVNESLKAFEDQNDSLQGENKNLQSTLQAEKDNLTRSRRDISDLKTEIQKMSDRIEQLDAENDRLKKLEDEIDACKNENKSLMIDLDEKSAAMTRMEQEIVELKNELSTIGERQRLHGKVAADIDVNNIEENCYVKDEHGDVVDGAEGNNMTQSSVHVVVDPVSKTTESDPDRCNLNVVEEGEVVEKRIFAEESPVQMQSAQIVGASPVVAQTKDPVGKEEVQPLSSSIYFDTSSTELQDRSFMSSTCSLLTPAELQDQTLVDELNQLKKDLKKTKAIYSRENSLLREALEQEKRVKNGSGSSKESVPKASDPHNGEKVTEVRKPEISEDEISLDQRIDVCLEQNKKLEEENSKLRTKIRKQEAVVLIYKHRLSEKEHDSEMWRKSLTSQLQALQKQRDDLVQLLRKQELGSSPSISEAIGQAAIKEESLRKVQDNLMEKMEELDHLHQMLTQRQVELQHCDMERRHLEQLCLLKDQTEMQLMKQKRLMEEQVSEIEQRLCEREAALMEEKTRLVEELKEKDERLLRMSQPQSPRVFPSSPSPSRSYSMGDLRLNVPGGEAFAFGGVDLSSSAEEADKQHLNAIQTLREKLKLEYDLRSSRLAESQASAVASYWMRHQSKNDHAAPYDDTS